MMRYNKIDNRGQARLFTNNFLERLTKTRPWVIYGLYIPLCSYMVYYAYSVLAIDPFTIGWLFVFAMFSWTLFEYLAHRYLFHFDASSKIGKRIVYIFHGNHHEYPRDKMRLFMPPLPSVIIASVVFAVFYVFSYILTGTGNYSLIYFPGFIIGYLMYVSMHYAIHAYKPPKYLKALWRIHHLHHYKYPEKGFGVSSTFWDYVFRTLPQKEQPDYKADQESGMNYRSDG